MHGLLLAALVVGGAALGYGLRVLYAVFRKKTLDLEIKEILLEAREEANAIIESAKNEERTRQSDVKKTEERLIKKEALLDGRQSDIDRAHDDIARHRDSIDAAKNELLEREELCEREFERIALLSPEEARAEIFEHVEKTCAEDLVARMQKLETLGREKLDARAQDILATIIQRYANSSIADKTITSVIILNEDIKGKIIGKEGRNIRTFEQATGVELLIDDTPGKILISSFDPIRRQIARVALENLIADGRIQPARIEECAEKAAREIDEITRQKGEEAVRTLGIYDLDPRIISLLGRLHYRTSYGQNVLAHSVEMAFLAGMLADELGADAHIAKAGALVHDIGKGIDHEIQGSHVKIGMRILQKFGTDERIITAMKSHHEEFPYESVEAIIVQIADALSGGRPGARNNSLEHYLKRLGDLEAIANSYPGVIKSFALQAGREIRIFVSPESISDLQAKTLARDIALQIEKELGYPGEIKIHVIRETRIVEYAR